MSGIISLLPRSPCLWSHWTMRGWLGKDVEYIQRIGPLSYLLDYLAPPLLRLALMSIYKRYNLFPICHLKIPVHISLPQMFFFTNFSIILLPSSWLPSSLAIGHESVSINHTNNYFLITIFCRVLSTVKISSQHYASGIWVVSVYHCLRVLLLWIDTMTKATLIVTTFN